ncbi:MAG: cell cycle transcriptional regulator TrcR [Caulobacterales bacterium]
MSVLMPKATAVWLIENTSLTFEQIADFCGLHELEVTHLAQKEGLSSIRGADPIARGDLERSEIEKGEKDQDYRMKASTPLNAAAISKKAPPRYTPVSRRQDRPDAIAWMVRNHPEVPDAQTAKLLGTTKATIESVRNRTHWNSAQIKPVDPVTLGLCTQIELDAIVGRAAELKARADLKKKKLEDGPKLQPIGAGEAPSDGADDGE